MRLSAGWLLCLCPWLISCNRPETPPAIAPAAPAAANLVEITQQVHLQFQHETGAITQYDMPQIMGSGACLFDIDGDQDLDILLIGGSSQPAGTTAGGNRLFRQEADGTFTDVTASSGLDSEGYGMGAAVGDIDNDGDLDLYLTRYGDDRLYRNNGQGEFEDITASSGIANPQWSTAATFLDYDRDGWLDLFVVNYVDFFPGSICEDGSGRRDFCGPESLAATADKFYRNTTGEAASGASPAPSFEDITVASGIATRSGKGLGVLADDFNGDGWLDLLVANDGQENFLWVQYEQGVFSNEALLRGVALNRQGEAEANMGVVAEDFNEDGWLDLLITHLRQESNTLYLGNGTGFWGAGQGQFRDQTTAAGLGVSSLPYTGFGIAAIDFDHDADLDLAIVNGGVKRGPPATTQDVPEFWRDYAQPNQLYLNRGEGRFEEASRQSGGAFTQPVEVSRALAAGDIDNDGDVDLLLSNCAGPARLYRNEFPKAGNWLSLNLIDPRLKRVAIGAQIQIQAGGRLLTRQCNPSSGYLSVNDLRVHVGLGQCARVDAIRVLWPDGERSVEVFPGVDTDQAITLERGTGSTMVESNR